MKRYREYMINSVKYEYSNGPLEGFNNKIKLVKRVSYGYNSFDNFRLRSIRIMKELVSIVKMPSSLKLLSILVIFSCPVFDIEPF